MDVRVIGRVLGDQVVAGDADVGAAVGHLVDDVLGALEEHLGAGNGRHPTNILARVRTPDAQPGALKEPPG